MLYVHSTFVVRRPELFVCTINYFVLATFVNLFDFHIALLSSVTRFPQF